MKRISLLCGFLTVVAGVCLVTAQESTRPANAKRAPNSPAAPANAAPTRIAATVGQKAVSEPGPIEELAARMASAFNQGDAKAFAAAFTAEGEYTDERGTSFYGRQAIEAEFAALFAAHKGT